MTQIVEKEKSPASMKSPKETDPTGTSKSLGGTQKDGDDPFASEREDRAISWTFLSAFLCFFCDYLLLTMQIPLFPLLGENHFRTGLLFAMKAIFQVLCSPLVNQIIDKVSRQKLVVFGLIIEIGSCVGFALTFSYDYWLFFRGVGGVGSSCILAGGQAMLQRAYAHDHQLRAKVLGLAMIGVVGGVCVGPLFGGALYEVEPALPYFVLVGMEVLTIIFVGMQVLEMRRRTKEAQEAQSSSGKEVANGTETTATAATNTTPATTNSTTTSEEVSSWELVKCWDILAPLVATVVENAGIGSLESSHAVHVSETFNFSPAELGAFYLLASVPSVCASGTGGYLGSWLYSIGREKKKTESDLEEEENDDDDDDVNESNNANKNTDATKGGDQIENNIESKSKDSKPLFASTQQVWLTMLWCGSFVQAFFCALGPKHLLWINAEINLQLLILIRTHFKVLTFFFMGLGVGFMDTPIAALLGEVADHKFSGTGKVYVLYQVAIQLGFAIGPLMANSMHESQGFQAACFLMSGVQIAWSILWIGWEMNAARSGEGAWAKGYAGVAKDAAGDVDDDVIAGSGNVEQIKTETNEATIEIQKTENGGSETINPEGVEVVVEEEQQEAPKVSKSDAPKA